MGASLLTDFFVDLIPSIPPCCDQAGWTDGLNFRCPIMKGERTFFVSTHGV